VEFVIHSTAQSVVEFDFDCDFRLAQFIFGGNQLLGEEGLGCMEQRIRMTLDQFGHRERRWIGNEHELGFLPKHFVGVPLQLGHILPESLAGYGQFLPFRFHIGSSLPEHQRKPPTMFAARVIRWLLPPADGRPWKGMPWDHREKINVPQFLAFSEKKAKG
jgi:hypothetical protein